MPKPWLEPLPGMIEKNQPECRKKSPERQDCTDREIWLDLRKSFAERRQRICGRVYDAKAKAPPHKRIFDI